MNAHELKEGRKRAGLSQVEAARKLGVSQPYLSLLEKGEREITARLARKAASLYDLPPGTLPVSFSDKVPVVSPDKIAGALAGLGYPGFAHLRAQTRQNPAQVLLMALAQRNLDARVTEALPWVVLRYPNMNWEWLRHYAKLHNLQNRLGFVTTLALRLTEATADDRAVVLKRNLDSLEPSRLANEDTLSHESLSAAEREWLRERRPEDARHWNLLTDLQAQHLRYATA